MRDYVFISYSHSDKKFLDALLVHLKPLERLGQVVPWSDKQITPGSKWWDEINSALARAQVAVMLVSPAFLASDFIHDHELGPLLKKAENEGVRILWIPVRACSYKETPLQNYQAVIPPDKPLAQMKAERDETWVRICGEIKQALVDSSKAFDAAVGSRPSPVPPSPLKSDTGPLSRGAHGLEPTHTPSSGRELEAGSVNQVVPRSPPQIGKAQKDSARSHRAGLAVIRALSMVFVDIMRLLCVASSQLAREANITRYQEFIAIARRHFGDFRSCVARFPGALSIEAESHTLDVERKLSWVLGRIEEQGPRQEHFTTMLQVAQLLEDLCRLEIGDEYSENIHQTEEHLCIIENGIAGEIGMPTIDELWRIRLRIQSQALDARKGSLRTIADDMDHDLAILYFAIDRTLLPLILASFAGQQGNR